MTGSHVADIQKLLNLMGIMYIESPPGIEAEQYGAFLTKGSHDNRFCTYMISGDSDVLCFGGNLLRISTVKSAASKKTVYSIFELDSVLVFLDFDYDQFLRMCASMGTDFCDKTDGVGPSKIVQKVRNDELYYSPAQEETMKYYKMDLTDKLNQSQIVQNAYSKLEVIEFLLSHSFNEDRIKTRLEKFI
jgi:5'-3' exonuclease